MARQALKLRSKRRVTELQGCHFETLSQCGTDRTLAGNGFEMDGDRFKLFIGLKNPRKDSSMTPAGMIYAQG